MRIFVVDDDRDFAESFAEALELRGDAVTLAFSGEEAVDIFAREEFDITLMDVRMPGMNGVESFFALRRLRPDARVVLMTGFSVEHLLAQAVEQGAWAVLSKPIAMDHVLEIIAGLHGSVLIADDNAEFAESLRAALEREGYTVLTADTGEEALETIEAGHVDILILDVRMPLLGGLEVYDELRRRGRAVPTLVVTAYADEEGHALGHLHECGVDVLTKPFDFRELMRALTELQPAGRS